MTTLLALTLTAVGLPACRGGNERRPPPPPVEGQTNSRANQTLTPAVALLADYQADRAAADAKYQGKTLLIWGTVNRIEEVSGKKVLALRAADDAPVLRCFLWDERDAKRVRIGQDVIVRGRVQGGDPPIVEDSIVQ